VVNLMDFMESEWSVEGHGILMNRVR